MVETLTSARNPRIKEIARLRRRRHRDRRHEMLIEGERELARAVEGNIVLRSLFYCPTLLSPDGWGLVQQAAEAGSSLFAVSEDLFARIAYRERSDGLLAIAKQPQRRLADLQVGENPLLVVVEGVEKPGNLGAVLRSADAAGADAVLVCEAATDIYNPNAVRSSVGMLFALPVLPCTTAEALEWLEERAVQIIAATSRADRPYTDVDLRGASALVMGSEKEGLSEAWLKAASIRVRIPMHGVGRSLNLLAATTVLLYEAVRQRAMEKALRRERR
jgi:TrmH family RNA methyltransferase